MSSFVIDSENNITVYRDGDSVPNVPDAERFTDKEEFRQLAGGWPAERLVKVWNGIPGLKPVKRFTDRKTATIRTWKAIQSLGAAVRGETPDVAMGEGEGRTAARRPRSRLNGNPSRRTAKRLTKPKTGRASREGTKTATILAMLRQPKGATLGEIMKATGWQAHSVRGCISGVLTKKMNLAIQSTKGEDGERSYKLAR